MHLHGVEKFTWDPRNHSLAAAWTNTRTTSPNCVPFASLGANRVYTVGVNKDVCRGEVHYAFDNEKAIVSAFNIWSFLHKPELILQANYVQVNGDNVKRVQKSWEHIEVDASTAVNFTTATKPDDTPLNKGFATGEIFYQERKLTP